MSGKDWKGHCVKMRDYMISENVRGTAKEK